MTPSEDTASTTVAPLKSDFERWADELERLAQAGVQKEIAATLALGIPVHVAGRGKDAGKKLMLMPDGRTLEYRVCPDGTRQVVGEIQR